ncbi:D-galacturonic acid binding lectin [Elysia marginata]|uniref:D-galacturonic acid binding lectin n=1 Tax=Elysia marginata TaxID=1093978 RepID=A0AAV4HDG6_9GAST|nr:D-galacturonic acid binding lectin [Elysia marginata]
MAPLLRVPLLGLFALASFIGLSSCQLDDRSRVSGVIFDMADQPTDQAGAAAASSEVAAKGSSSGSGLRCGRVYLRSYRYRFRRYRISVAIRVLNLDLLKEYSNGACTKGLTFGTYGTDVWANGGCRGLFAICIIPGDNYILSCFSVSFKPQRCYVGEYIKAVTIYRHKSASPCVEGFSYRIEGQELVVFNGCRAEFVVAYR